MKTGDKERTLSNLRIATSLHDCQEADLVIEAAAEKEEVKKQIFQELDRLCRKEAVFATNTSAISITRLAGSTERPAQIYRNAFYEPCP